MKIVRKTGCVVLFVVLAAFINPVLCAGSPGPGNGEKSEQRKKVALIVPGRNEYPENRSYVRIKEYFEQQKYTAHIVRVNWKEVTLDTLVEKGNQALAPFFDRYSEADITLFGFSFGAVIVLKNIHRRQVVQVIAASLSPVFKEDILFFPAFFPFLIFRFYDYNKNNLYYPEPRDKPLVFFYGTRDSFVISKKIIKERSLYFWKADLIFVEHARHNLAGEDYQKALKNYISTL